MIACMFCLIFIVSILSTLSYRTNFHIRSEYVYTLPASKVIDNRRRAVLECLERSEHENGHSKQHSGYGVKGTSPITGPDSMRNHFSNVYDEIDPVFSANLARTVLNTFPIKRIHHLCNTYESHWRKHRVDRIRSSGTGGENEDARGPFPYVDDKATVLGELSRAEILRTRHRVNSYSHPRWAIRTIRRRKRKQLLRLKRRSISQERIRSLQAKLISSKPVVSD